MYRPPKHAADCRGKEDPLLGNAMSCRACSWFDAVDRLVDAADQLADGAKEEFAAFLGGAADRVREQLRRIENLR